jgi:predicted regulator of Ras-like GTPase activity (Roadblock/LC7/MglB family)
MAGEILGKVADLLGDALKVHRSVKDVILCTREGVVVAAVSRKNESIDPKVLSTVSAALVWAGTNVLGRVGKAKPSYLLHSTQTETILTALQPHYYLVIVLARNEQTGADPAILVSKFQSIATRIELLMGSSAAPSRETLLGNIVKAFPEITQAMLLTVEGLPLSSVGVEDYVEIAAMVSSIFANGLTYSNRTESIVINSEQVDLLVTRVDETRLLAVVCRGTQPDTLSKKVMTFLQENVAP